MTSPNVVSLCQWQSCMTTNSSLGDWYMRTHLLVSVMVEMKEPPWRWIIRISAPFGPGSGYCMGLNCCSAYCTQKPSPSHSIWPSRMASGRMMR